MAMQGRWRTGISGMVLVLLSGCGGNGGGADVKVQQGLQLPDPKAMFSWTTEQKIIGFSHTAELSSTEVFSRGGSVSPLPEASADLKARALAVRYQYGLNADGSARKGNTLDDYMQHSKATGLLVIKNGAVAVEKYAHGLDSKSLWDSKSVAKSVVSTLMGVALRDGYISSLDNLVTQYVPELVNTAYAGVTLRHVLHMASGVAWSENYLDPASNIAQLLRCYTGSDATACLLQHIKTLRRAADAGAVFNYSSGEAFLAGLVVQRATGQSLGQYMQRKIWQPYGMEADGRWLSNGGIAFGGGGFNATLRDYGRFGQFILHNGMLPNGSKALPDNWVRDATTWQANTAIPGYGDNGIYGYMWWFGPAYENGLKPDPLYVNLGAPLQNTNLPGGAVPVQQREPVAGKPGSVSDWTFAAMGIYGQMIAINQAENIVVVQWSTWDKPEPTFTDPKSPTYDPTDPYNEQSVFLNAIISALH